MAAEQVGPRGLKVITAAEGFLGEKGYKEYKEYKENKEYKG